MNSDQMADVISVIRSAQGTNKKKSILSAYPEMTNILRTTYSPFIHFNIAPQQSWITMNGDAVFSDSTVALLRGLAMGELSGRAARAAVKKHLNELTYKSAQLLMRVLGKTLDFGLAIKGINDVFPGCIPVHAIQLAKPFEPRRCQFPCYVSPKLDGLRVTYGDGVFRTRKGHVLVGLTELERQMTDLETRVPGPLFFDGELMVDGEHFNEISGQLRSFNETDKAHYHIFDLHNSSTPQWSRLGALDHLHAHVQYPNISFVPHTVVTSHDAIMEKYQEYLDRGYEGAIVKSENGLYQDSRTWDWMKLKTTTTEDCPVLGIFEGTGKYSGMVGGLIVRFGDVDVRVGSGLSDLQRASWMVDPDEIIGAIVEVAFQEVTQDGSMRHPRLKCVRGDK